MEEILVEPALTDMVLSALWRATRNARQRAPETSPPATAGWIEARIRPRLASIAEIEAVLEALIAEGSVQQEQDGYLLSNTASARAREAHHEVSQAYFGRWLCRMEDSAASHDFCARVYDTGLLHFNMLDREQLEAGIEALTAGPTLLEDRQLADLGCATGVLTEHMARVTGARILGVDFAREAIARANRRATERLSFEVARLDDWTPSPASLDGVVLFDTVYFVDDLPRLVGAALRGLRPGGRVVAFVSAHVTDEQPKSLLEPAQTPFGRALVANDAKYTARDFLASAHAKWRRSQIAVEEMEAAFEAEGSRDLWESRRDETRAILERHDAGCSARWMYVVDASE